jgi:hypothetical protein
MRPADETGTRVSKHACHVANQLDRSPNLVSRLEGAEITRRAAQSFLRPIRKRREAVTQQISLVVHGCHCQATPSSPGKIELMSARHRANRDRNRRAAWARRLAADQRREAQRAAANLWRISRQIRSIQTRGRAKQSSVGRLRGAGVVTAILPNGRRSRMRIIPTVAPIAEINRLRSAQAAAIEKNARAIAALAAAQAAAIKKLSAAQVESDNELRKRLVEADSRLSQRTAKKLSGTARRR